MSSADEASAADRAVEEAEAALARATAARRRIRPCCPVSTEALDRSSEIPELGTLKKIRGQERSEFLLATYELLKILTDPS